MNNKSDYNSPFGMQWELDRCGDEMCVPNNPHPHHPSPCQPKHTCNCKQYADHRIVEALRTIEFVQDKSNPNVYTLMVAGRPSGSITVTESPVITDFKWSAQDKKLSIEFGGQTFDVILDGIEGKSYTSGEGISIVDGVISSTIDTSDFIKKDEAKNFVQYMQVSADRKAIVLDYGDAILGSDEDGNLFNVVQLTKNKSVTLGNQSCHANIVSSDRPTVNSNEEVAYLSDVNYVREQVDKFGPVETIVTEEKLSKALESYVTDEDMESKLNDYVKHEELEEKLSGYATNESVIQQIEEYTKDVVTETFLNDKLEGYVTKEEFDGLDEKFQPIGDYATKDEIPSTDNLVTKEELENAISDKVTTDEAKTFVKYTEHQDEEGRKSIILENNDMIMGRMQDGTPRNLVMMSKWDKADFGTAHTELNLNSSKRPTVNDIEEIAYKSDIPDTENFALKSDIPSVDGLASEEFVNGRISEVEGKIPSVSGLASESWVEEQGYLKEHQDVSGLATKEDISEMATKSYVDDEIEKIQVPNIEGLASEEYVNQQIESVKSEIPSIEGLVKSDEISDMETKTHAQETYQPKGDYALKSDIPNVEDMLTKTEADNEYQKKGDYAEYATFEGNRKTLALKKRDTISSEGINIGMVSDYEGLDFPVVEIGGQNGALVLNTCENVVKVEVNENGKRTQHSVATTDDLDNYQPKGDYALKSDIPSVDGLVKEEAIEDMLTKTEAGAEYQKKGDYVEFSTFDGNRKSLVLNKRDTISSEGINIAMVSDYDGVDKPCVEIGTGKAHLILNASDGVVKIDNGSGASGQKIVATLDDIPEVPVFVPFTTEEIEEMFDNL